MHLLIILAVILLSAFSDKTNTKPIIPAVNAGHNIV